MEVTHAFAGVPVADYAAANCWYERLFGRPADMRPHDKEAVWHLTPNGSIYVVEDRERAGTGLVTLALSDLDAQEKRLRNDALTVMEADGVAPRRIVVRDIDGNTLTFFQDPAASGA